VVTGKVGTVEICGKACDSHGPRLVSRRVDFDWNTGKATMVTGRRRPVLPVLPIMPSFKYLSHSTIASNEERIGGRAVAVTSLV
jgi:hypothetical protein